MHLYILNIPDANIHSILSLWFPLLITDQFTLLLEHPKLPGACDTVKDAASLQYGTCT